MFKKLLELRQKKAEHAAEMRALLENAEKENRSLNEEESGKFDKLKESVKQVSEEIERYETVADEERSLGLQGGKPVET
ncbi:TPA: phage major capsid protein, partial [Pasteurella multocida]|nr:phage major capsid protein [Pasteurella multocida]